jgi:hypothetical protein
MLAEPTTALTRFNYPDDHISRFGLGIFLEGPSAPRSVKGDSLVNVKRMCPFAAIAQRRLQGTAAHKNEMVTGNQIWSEIQYKDTNSAIAAALMMTAQVHPRVCMLRELTRSPITL